jgi:hypothetical protein
MIIQTAAIAKSEIAYGKRANYGSAAERVGFCYKIQRSLSLTDPKKLQVRENGLVPILIGLYF